MRMPYASVPRSCHWLALAILAIPASVVADGPPADESMRALGGKFVDFGYKASWSPDGKRIAYGASGPQRSLKIIDLDSGEINTVVADAKDPAWQPGDGKRIAYVRGQGAQEEVRIVNLDGTHDQKVADGGMPSWSKRGTVLFYHSRKAGQIMASEVEDDGFGEPSPLARIPSYYPALNPQTTRVAVIENGKLTITDLSGEDRRMWTVPGAQGGITTWSHDGKLVSAGGFGGFDKAELTLLNAVTGESARLAANGYLMPIWSPDGKQVAVDLRPKSGDWSIWVFPAAKLGELKWGKEALHAADSTLTEQR